MTRSDDPDADMVDVGRLDADTVELLLSGRMDPELAPPALAGVAELFRALVAPPTRVELTGRAAAVVAASAFLTPPPLERVERPGSRASRGRIGSRFLRTKVASLAFAGTLLGTTGLAAAGVLPDPVQEVAHRILSKVGIDVPSSSDHRSADPEDETGRPADAGTGQVGENGGHGRPAWVVGPTQGGSHNQGNGNGASGSIHGRDEGNQRNDEHGDHRNDGDDHGQGNGKHHGDGSGNGHDDTNGNGRGNAEGNAGGSDGEANVKADHSDGGEPEGGTGETDENGNASGGAEESR